MTDDIVTRLREHQNPHYPLDEAADEIERLRREVDNLKAEVQRLSQIANYQ